MTITRLSGANAITVTLPAVNINDTSIGNITALPAGVGGKVLQVVTATDSTLRTTTSTSFTAAGSTLAVAITPSSASNKIFVIVSANIVNGSGDGFVYATIYRDSTNLGDSTYGMCVGNSVSGITPIDHPACVTILDSPSSTSALTYQFYFRSNNASYTASINGRSSVATTKSSITAFEIAG